jgi:hypothetical protein
LYSSNVFFENKKALLYEGVDGPEEDCGEYVDEVGLYGGDVGPRNK